MQLIVDTHAHPLTWTHTSKTGVVETCLHQRFHNYQMNIKSMKFGSRITQTHQHIKMCKFTDLYSTFMATHTCAHTHIHRISWTHLLFSALLYSLRIWTFSTHKEKTALLSLSRKGWSILWHLFSFCSYVSLWISEHSIHKTFIL